MARHASAIAVLLMSAGNSLAASAQERVVANGDSVSNVSVVGTVRNAETRAGLIASIIVSDSQPVRSDSSGHFRVSVPPGSVVFRIRAVGFAPLDTLVVVSASHRDLEFQLTRGAVTLHAVETTALANKPARYANTTKYDEFYERRTGAIGGTFLTREDVERSGALEVVELLRGISGVKIERDRFGLPTVILNRCKTAIEQRSGDGASDRTVQVFVDGRKVYDGFDTLQMLKAGDVEAMEVYTSVASLPIVARGDGCGAIFIWTR